MSRNIEIDILIRSDNYVEYVMKGITVELRRDEE